MGGQEMSLVEMLLDHLQNSDGADVGEGSQPEEILLRQDVASQLDSRLQSHLLYCLLERSASEAVPSSSRNETKLDWVTGILQADLPESGLAAYLADNRDSMVTFIEILVRGQAPAQLAEAPADSKRRISKSARLAMKGLNLLLPRK